MTPEKQLRVALAHVLNDNRLGVYKDSGVYQTDEAAIFTTGYTPVFDEFTSLISPPTTRDGRADALFRVQFFTQRKGNADTVEQWAHELSKVLDHKEYFPNILGISWTEEYSRLYFDADTQGRVSVTVNYSFRGRA
ncbi:hypothetical protein [Paramicrobacterium chengjingii]|uniref:Phage tail protein n=1 Tax=Paramicrobacterium chengjingii TaxID=2769067 RepID=A0ABX6YM06_9MICO|nr:hypothetical protein [Microbacterium chengjingii]QPZ39700.1 hypothetical protein HCR76_06550 [Microbacterium chengjingii]